MKPELTYIRSGDDWIPDLKLESTEQRPLNKYYNILRKHSYSLLYNFLYTLLCKHQYNYLSIRDTTLPY